MDAELKAQWTEALRSGHYAQGRHALKDSQSRYCCLGVLCEVAGLSTRRIPEVWNSPYDQILLLVGNLDRQMELIEMNDSGEHSFSDIATYIEENL